MSISETLGLARHPHHDIFKAVWYPIRSGPFMRFLAPLRRLRSTLHSPSTVFLRISLLSCVPITDCLPVVVVHSLQFMLRSCSLQPECVGQESFLFTHVSLLHIYLNRVRNHDFWMDTVDWQNFARPAGRSQKMQHVFSYLGRRYILHENKIADTRADVSQAASFEDTHPRACHRRGIDEPRHFHLLS